MKRTAVALGALSFLLFTGLTAAEKPLPPLAIVVDVAPSSNDPIQLLTRKTPDTFTCQATVMKPEIVDRAMHVYAGIELVVAPGKRDTLTRKGEDFDVRFTVAVSKARDRAATEVAILRGEEVLHLQKSDVLLKPAERAGIVPLQ